MVKRRFMQCDVFTATAIQGNGLAVVIDGDGVSDDLMQSFAAWTNLAETTFLLPATDPAADYRVRIFTPAREMPFAGHPTLGSCAAWLHAGNTPRQSDTVIQECAIGLVPIDISGAIPAFVAPPTKIAPLPAQNIDALVSVLGLRPDQVVNAAHLNNGPVWQTLELATAADVLAVDANKVRWPEYVGVSLVGAYPPGSPCDYEVRNISPSSGMSEDPITGSLNAAIACWLLQQGRLNGPLTMAQGTNVNRTGRVYLCTSPADPTCVYVGGETQIVIDGTVDL